MPAFCFVAFSAPFVAKLRNSRIAANFWDGVNASAVALMVVAICQRFSTAVVDVGSAGLPLVGLATVLFLPINSMWLCLIGGLIGLLLH